MNLGMPKLCYVCERRRLAYFTTQDVTKQWGDDWNDPLDNSSPPYDDYNNKTEPKWKIFYVVYDSTELHGPDNEGQASRSSLSAESINKGKVTPWLASSTDWSGKPTKEKPIALYAGTTIYEFLNELDREGIAYGLPLDLKEYLGTPPDTQSPHANCPGCGVGLENVQMSAAGIINVNGTLDPKFNAMFFRCPYCKVILPGEMVHAPR
jgi:hypothetical protein